MQIIYRLMAAAVLGGSPVATFATITDVRAGSTGSIQIAPPAAGFGFSGTVLEEYRSTSLGTGAGFDATSDIDGDFIFFENGTMASGPFGFARAETLVDIDFVNSLAVPIQTSLQSTIFPTGFGFYVAEFGGGCSGATLPDCAETASGPGFAAFRATPGAAQGQAIAGVGFVFDVLSDGVVARSLRGSITIVRDPATGMVSFVEDFDDAAAILNNFRLVTDPGNPYAYAYAWDETPYTVDFGTVLAPGASRTVTYRTITESWTYASQAAESSSLNQIIGFAGFADPVGRGGGFNALSRLAGPFATQQTGTIDGIRFVQQRLQLPRFENGVIIFEPAAAVPEPGTWAMMILGFGLVGGMLRRRRHEAATAPGRR